jgi:hypothetical protein
MRWRSHGPTILQMRYSFRSERLAQTAARVALATFILLSLGVGASSAQSWIQLTPGVPTPAARYGATSVYNPTSNRMIVFGGYVLNAPNGQTHQNDVWILTGANGNGTPSWTQAIPNGTSGSPPGRQGGSAVYDQSTNRMIIFGGTDPSGTTFNDVWVLLNGDGTSGTPTWQQMFPSGTIPQRALHGAVYDPVNNRMIVFGGQTPGVCPCTHLNDVWVLTNANGAEATPPTWIQLNPVGQLPAQRSDFVSAYDISSNRLIVFGGLASNAQVLADVWVLTNANGLGGSPTWQPLSPAGFQLFRFGLNGAYDSVTNRLIVFGGFAQDIQNSPSLNDTWFLTGANGLGGTVQWQQEPVSGALPPGRATSGLVYDGVTNRLVVFGGLQNGQALSDTWVLTNANGVTGNQLQISSVMPNQGGNAGTTSVKLFGAGFQAGAQVKLSGGAGSADVLGTNANVIDTGLLTATFDLRGSIPGNRDLVVTNPDNSSVTLTAGFTIEAGGVPQISGTILGSSLVRVATPAAFVPVLTNAGLIDADLAFFYMTGSGLGLLGSPAGSTFVQPGFTLLQGGFTGVPSQSQIALPPSSISPPSPGCGIMELFGGAVTPQSYTCDQLASLVNAAEAAQEAVQIERLVNLGQILNKIKQGKCYGQLPLSNNENALCDVLLDIDDAEDAQATGNDAATKALCAAANNQGCPMDCPLFDIDPFEVIASTINVEIHNLKTLLQLSAIDLAVVSSEITDAQNGQLLTLPRVPCTNCTLPQALSTPQSSTTSCAGTSLDPNGKSGSVGSGSAQYVSDSIPLPYTIRFENLPVATLPAQQVLITDQLDPGLDWSTVSFYSMGFGSSFVNLGGTGSFHGSLDLRPDKNLIVRFDAQVDPNTGLLTSRLTSIDPITGSPPTDPLSGFLPPDITPPQGDGSVFFTVNPKPGLSTNIQIQNQATVVFDMNPAISTPTWMNTIDNTPPTSKVTALPAIENAKAFTVQWSGTDVGAGVKDFTVFVSDDGGPFTTFQMNTTATSATFTGQSNHTYGFYTIARDLVGNVEGAKTVAESTTQVILDTTPPVTVASVSPGPNTNGWNNTNVTVALNSTDNEPNGTGVKDIIYGATGAQNIAATIVNGASTSFIISTEGITTITFFGTDNAGNIEVMRTITIRLDKTPPTVTCSPNPNLLWPPNNKLVPVNVSVNVTDSLSGPAGFNLVSVTSNEPDSGLGEIQGFVVGTPSTSGQLQAQRLGSGSGRIYTFTYSGADRAGNLTSCTTTVSVPHDQGK